MIKKNIKQDSEARIFDSNSYIDAFECVKEIEQNSIYANKIGSNKVQDPKNDRLEKNILNGKEIILYKIILLSFIFRLKIFFSLPFTLIISINLNFFV